MIEMSDRAVAKIKELMASNNLPTDTGGIRFGLEGGGCAGFKYFFKPENNTESGDMIFERDGGRIFVDSASFVFVDGSMLDWDWVDHLMGEGFKIENPQAKGGCGCGVSVKF